MSRSASTPKTVRFSGDTLDGSSQRKGSKAKKQRPSTVQFALHPAVAFTIFAACNSLAAVHAPIQDCDEVFNYWEPTHYLTNGYGFQTWEYAPAYAIRSWAYAGLHALPLALIQRLWTNVPKPVLFYSLRLLLGLACAACTTKLFSAVQRTVNERMAVLFLLIMITSPGMFHASVAYLPSSFAMYTAMLGAAYFVDHTDGYKTSRGILCFGIGAMLGWPFAGALILPFLYEEATLTTFTTKSSQKISLLQVDWSKVGALVRRWTAGIAQCLLVLAIQTTVDSVLYRKPVIVPLNIVLYNVFSSKGPELYGTEPWHFYVRNLTLNFHAWFFLAVAAFPLLCLHFALADWNKVRSFRSFYFVTPFYLWLAIFTLQPHKEERFMYPAYPFLALNAAYSLHVLLSAWGNTQPASLVSRLPKYFRLWVVLGFMLVTLATSILRIAATWTAFSAPLAVYSPLNSSPINTTVCLGKEWYRFPSHYLVSDHVRAKFIRSEFRGLLPGSFATGNSAYPFSATWQEAGGMNDDNIEDMSKYVDLSACDYIIDSHLPSTAVTSFEPNFLASPGWRKMHCAPFLDAASTGVIGRLSWIPGFRFVPDRVHRVWGEYCLLKRVDE